MDAFRRSWHSHLMLRRAVPRHFLIVFALAYVLAAHGLLAAWGTGTFANAGNLGVPALFCISGQSGVPSEPNSLPGQPPHHDCAMACAGLAGPAPASADSGFLVVPPTGAGVVMTALGDETGPILFFRSVQARGPPQTA